MQGRIYAHRGMRSLAPENTLSAFRKMADYGQQWLETDVDILGDGTPILMHDTLLDRTTNRSGFFYDLRAEDLPGIDAGSWFSPEFTGEPLPRLAQLVDLMNELELNANIELKSHERGAAGSAQLVENTLRELSRLDPGREVIISSFNHLLLRLVRERTDRYPLAALFVKENLLDDWRSVAELCGATVIHPETTGLSRGRVREMRDAGFDVNVYTVNDRGRANELFNWGVTGIFTDYAQNF
ncbi:glycerophosphoryl diester phosphodiesterase [Boudabousia marimammalium]|uniref:Glycerophosphoryl diester phosphodiesterase n=1 Tax=Boudabousia marimammalium TaxID=156892 RepID=A0A1Q5PKE8_9ACTO|nr:glycerophosphoryl diester phosphodiesterase [Boudabousia marimammalium]OKL46697.1 glycerophosphoryl diester phosphodiesterase [Boudabousia marimammalium]